MEVVPEVTPSSTMDMTISFLAQVGQTVQSASHALNMFELFVIFNVQSLLCHLCFANSAWNLCSGVFALHSLLCSLCFAIFAALLCSLCKSYFRLNRQVGGDLADLKHAELVSKMILRQVRQLGGTGGVCGGEGAWCIFWITIKSPWVQALIGKMHESATKSFGVRSWCQTHFANVLELEGLILMPNQDMFGVRKADSNAKRCFNNVWR